MIFTSTAMICLVLAETSDSTPVVNSGDYVTLQCISWQKYDGFILTKEGDPKFSRTLDSKYVFTGHLQAMFSVGPMTPSNKGKFRCYGYYKRDPQKWSMASDPLDIHVSGVTETITSSEVKIAPQPQNHRMDNLIRIAMIGLVFLVLGILQLKTWCS
ncbi:leukocyte immunoglobulin-like receptor subfamily A member 5 [Sigmodon hispidus]